MLSQSQQKLIRSLQQKKYRLSEGLYVAEGVKVVHDLLNSPAKIHSLYGTERGLHSIADVELTVDCLMLSERDMVQLSSQTNPEGLLAVVHMPTLEYKPGEWVLVLDAINDPGNFGTIVRTARWFGVNTIICTQGTVDAYNPKCVQSAKGSLFHTDIHYLEVDDILELFRNEGRTICLADMDGGTEHTATEGPKALVLGSESHGAHPAFKMAASEVLSIPAHASAAGMDSLNVAVSCGILLSRVVV